MTELIFSVLVMLGNADNQQIVQEQGSNIILAILEQADREQQAAYAETIVEFLPVNKDLAIEIAEGLHESCREFGVDRKLMLALIYVESTGNPNAISHVGAIGLTQIMPATGEQIASELGVEWTGPDMLLDVRTNIRFGTYYMRKLLDRFEGSQLPAVQSYNWGPTSISRMLRDGHTIPTGYARKVLRTRAEVTL